MSSMVMTDVRARAPACSSAGFGRAWPCAVYAHKLRSYVTKLNNNNNNNNNKLKVLGA